MSEQVNFRAMLRDRKFMQIFIAGIVSRFGDAVDMIAYSFMVYELTGSAVLMAVLYAVNGIPSLIFNMISGVVVTRLPKKHVIWVCDFLRGTVVLFTAILYFSDTLQVWHLYLFTVLNSTFESFRAPSSSSLFVHLISKEQIEHATSLNTSARTFAELIGYGAASMIIGLIGVSGAIFVDALTFYVAGIIIMSIADVNEVLVKTKLTVGVYFEELKEGVMYVVKTPLIKSITLFLGGIMLFIAPFNALQVPYILEYMDMGYLGITIMSITFMVAIILGSLLVPMMTKRFGGRKVFLLGILVVGVGYSGFSIIQFMSGSVYGYIGLVIVTFIMGSTISFMQVPISTALMRQVDQKLITRVFSLVNIMALAAVPIGGGLSGVLVNYISIPVLFAITGGAIILLFISQTFNKTLYGLNDTSK